MKKWLKMASFIVLSTALVGCANNENVGTFTGAAVGGLIGSQFGGGTGRALATGAGVFAGAVIGNQIGKRMDEVDRMRMSQALERAPDHRASAWTNPNTGVRYSVEPTKTFNRRGTPCREYRTTAFIGGRKQQVYGTACRQADGSWRIKS